MEKLFYTADEISWKIGIETSTFLMEVSRGFYPQGYGIGRTTKRWTKEDVTAIIWIESNKHRFIKKLTLRKDPLVKPVPSEAFRDGARVVYFIQEPATHAIKIGFSTNLRKRLESLQSANPYQLALLGALPDHDEKAEKRLHKRFDIYRLEGEWFTKDITDEVLNLLA